jgi:phosphoketolase
VLHPVSTRTTTPADLERIDAYWRAANYLSVGQIYLLDNPLLREPLAAEHVKPRLLGHWGTTPGLNLLYAHLNRVIADRDLNALYVTGPGHGGPGLVANAYLEGTYSEVHPAIGRDEDGMRALFRQFSFPGGIPSHVAPETPGSIHEGGELGYALVHAFGAVFDNPDLLRCASSGTVRRRPGRWPRAGTRTSSSTRSRTGRCCRCCTSTATRSPTRRCWRASRSPSSPTSCAATATRRTSWAATTR